MLFVKWLLRNMMVVLFFSLWTVVANGESEPAKGITCRLEKVGDQVIESYIPSVVIPHMVKAPTMDGVLEKGEWQGAESIEQFFIPKTTQKANPPTQAWLGVDRQKLYAAFRCRVAPGVEPKAEVKQHDGSVYKDDSIECFIWPVWSQPVYYHFGVNSLATRFDSKNAFDPSRGRIASSGANWNPAWEAKTRREQDAWTLEMAIPLSELGIEAQGIKAIRLNLCRNIVPGTNRFASWSFLPQVNFHRPQDFGMGLCTFGVQRKGRFDISKMTGLGGGGLLRIERKGRPLILPDVGDVMVRAALPERLFSEATVLLEPRIIPILAGGKEGASISMGTLRLKSSEPANLLVNGVKPGDFKLPLHLLGEGISRLDEDLYEISIRLNVNDKEGQTLGTSESSLLVADKTFQKIWSRFETINLSEMSQAEPFKAAAYLGAAACFEKLKRGIELGGTLKILDAICEGIDRLALLETDRLPAVVHELDDLLILTAHPEAQVVVEYYPGWTNKTQTWASVSFYWGAFPLASGQVQELASDKEAEEARKNLESRFLSKGLRDLSEKNTIFGLPAWVSSKSYEYQSIPFSKFDPDQQILVCNFRYKFAFALDIKDIAWAQPEVVVLLESASDMVRKTVESWVGDAKVPVLKPDEACKKEWVLVAGDPHQDKITEGICKFRLSRIQGIHPSGTTLKVISGRRMIDIRGCPSQEIAEQVVKLIVDAKPVQPTDMDILRQALVKAIKPAGEAPALPEGMSLFCGDVHMHSFYSDGTLSPVGMALQSLYCGMDFAVISDHNAIEGAKVAQELLSRHGLAYSVIVGEEITTSWAHLNAYPLHNVISQNLSPYETIKAAHVQGAVIQWNHPGHTRSEWEQTCLEKGIAGTGLNAWEHIPQQYDEWEKQEKLPLIVGSSDAHSGIFGWSERTVILAPSPDGDDLAEAIRRGKVVALSASDPKLLYGPTDMIALVSKALADGKALKAAKAEQLKKVLKNVDLGGLLKDSLPTP